MDESRAREADRGDGSAEATGTGKHQVIHLVGVAHGGEAVGRLQGKAVFVPFAIPGEDALVRVDQDRVSYARAALVEVLAPSAQRRVPACPHFGPGLCGGCHWQHMDYPLQLELKARVVREQLARIGGIADAPVRPAVGIADPWRYRNHIRLLAGTGGALAYQAAGTNRPVTIGACPIAHPLLAGMVTPPDGTGPWRLPAGLAGGGATGVTLRAGVATGQRLMIVEGGSEARPGSEGGFAVAGETGCRLTMLRGRPFLEERLGGQTFRVSPRSFFQVNTAQAERLAALVLEYAALTGSERVLDCFCGVGVFGLLMAPHAGQVIGIEESPGAVADARHNAAGTAHFSILAGRAERLMAGLGGRVDVAVVDPPRQGCAPAVIDGLARLAPRRIVYVSCDPATLARDLAALGKNGYRLAEATPVDMFPQTFHVETVAVMSRVNE